LAIGHSHARRRYGMASPRRGASVESRSASSLKALISASSLKALIYPNNTTFIFFVKLFILLTKLFFFVKLFVNRKTNKQTNKRNDRRWFQAFL
jgi:hypothetical protein